MSGSSLSSVERERVEKQVYASPVVEVATAAARKPVTFPLTPFYDSERETVIVTSAPAYAGKIDHVRAEPEVGVLFYLGDDPFVLRGTATVDDDLRANAEYVSELIRAEPDTPKREAFRDSALTEQSGLEKFLMDWYRLRIVVEIEPTAIEPLDSAATTSSPPSWPAVDMSDAEAESYERVVFTAVDEEGYPVPRRVMDLDVRGEDAEVSRSDPSCSTFRAAKSGTAQVALANECSVADGQPACLLLHWHSDDVETLGQRLVRGRCRPTDGGVVFSPGSSFSLRSETALDALRFVLDGKRRTRAYFDDTGLLDWWW